MDDDDDGREKKTRSPRGSISNNPDTSAGAGGNEGPGAAMGPIYIMWESALEKLKILDYEQGFCATTNRKPFSRIHFVFPAANLSHQFNDFVELCVWLCTKITDDPAFFKRDTYDDPNTVANKLMLALRQLEFKSSFPSQKLKTANGESVCLVLDFLTNKALERVQFTWKVPRYIDNDKVEHADVDNEEEEEEEIIEEGDIQNTDDMQVQESVRDDIAEVEVDEDAHQILQAMIDPVEWKTELERVGPKLKAQQQLSTNEWRGHVDQTVTSKTHIEKVLGETEGELKNMQKEVAEELNRMKTKEGYVNKQFSVLCSEFKEVKQRFEEIETVNHKTNDRVLKLTNDLAEQTERLEELKESFESKDSGIHDTSPLVRIKAALQQIKQETQAFDLRIGVVSHALLSEKVNSMARRRFGAVKKAQKRHNKMKHRPRDSDDDDDDD
eukprot:CAMPEP_0182437592 /NCGR_PEP_ID=MMETSP1167-20130531/85144_1 /TAXON_ID=2988 /ORGANISM="Mallomonas Sp, Strain CCMP3275" /LENGTH=440 /DNA_ID=CAMNT_0024630559 /DNA_START=28 /DNA_END=1350 /DNA_ORIENTATION=-